MENNYYAQQKKRIKCGNGKKKERKHTCAKYIFYKVFNKSLLENNICKFNTSKKSCLFARAGSKIIWLKVYY